VQHVVGGKLNKRFGKPLLQVKKARPKIFDLQVVEHTERLWSHIQTRPSQIDAFK
jgi:hypothetical protein